MSLPVGHPKKLVFPSRCREAQSALQTILADVRSYAYSQDAVFAIHLGLDEAISNAVQHGNCGDPDKKVAVEYCVTDEAFEITITDEGGGFTPSELPDPTADENLERPCGRGVMLMKTYMSQVSFNECGNRVTMIKYRNCSLPVRPK